MFPQQKINKQQQGNSCKRCFLCRPCRGCIRRTPAESTVSHENTRGLNLAVIKLTTVQMTKLPSYRKIHKICMICFAKSVLAEDLCIVQKEEFSITRYMCDTYSWQKAKHIHYSINSVIDTYRWFGGIFCLLLLFRNIYSAEKKAYSKERMPSQVSLFSLPRVTLSLAVFSLASCFSTLRTQATKFSETWEPIY
jgi:hypothetical protein